MLGEVFLLFAAVLATITTLYHLRGVSFIGDYLSVIVTVLLIYPALWHKTRRRLPIRFFEGNFSHLLRSLKMFALAAGLIFPLFFLAAHAYQTLLFDMTFSFRGVRFGWEEVAVQLLLVALPEEFFFRGYLQTMIGTKVTKTFRPFGLKALEVTWAVPLACLLFALSHSIITFRWWHFAIFFPSLVFGWLRERTGGLTAPILFHATSNLVINQIGYMYR